MATEPPDSLDAEDAAVILELLAEGCTDDEARALVAQARAYLDSLNAVPPPDDPK
jgi:hypothetical protein